MQKMDSAVHREPGISPGCEVTSSRLAQGCTSWLALTSVLPYIQTG